MVQLEPLVRRLPSQLDSEVAECGVVLSGGPSSCCVWLERSYGGPRCSVWMRPRPMWMWRPTASYSASYDSSSVAATPHSSPSLTAYTPWMNDIPLIT